VKRPGFTLLEATVAMVVLGTVAIGALAAFAAEARAAARANALAPAAALARERLSRLELLDAHALRTLPESLSRGSEALGTQSYEWSATAHAVAGESDLYDLAVEVRYEDGRYALRTRSFRPAVTGVQGGIR